MDFIPAVTCIQWLLRCKTPFLRLAALRPLLFTADSVAIILENSGKSVMGATRGRFYIISQSVLNGEIILKLLAGLVPAGVEVIIPMVAKVECGLENIL